jgi:SRSO17 transposase
MTTVSSTCDSRVLLDDLLERVGPRFTRPEPRQRAQLFVRGVLSGLARKNSWTLAGYAGETDPTGMQRLLTSARWDVDGVRDDLRAWVLERLGDPEQAVLVPIEAGFPKKGTGSVGVHRHYNDTTRRAENVQLGLFLVYAAPRGWAVVDRELYLPPAWAGDAQRCARLGVPGDVGFAAKPELARRMIQRVLRTGIGKPWVTTSEAFGADPDLRSWLDGRNLPYAVAVGTADPTRPGIWARSENLPGWERLQLARPTPTGNRLVQYDCRVPVGATMQDLSRLIGMRYRIEAQFALARGEMGLDHYQVRRYDAWYRHVTLCMLAGAYLTVARSAE